MAKIGTAQVEIKAVLNEEALDAACKEIERRVAQAVQRGMRAALAPEPSKPMPWGGQITTLTHNGPATAAEREEMTRNITARMRAAVASSL